MKPAHSTIRWLFILAVLGVAACGGPLRHEEFPGRTSHVPGLEGRDAIDAILGVLDSTPIVAISDLHELAELGDFRLRLLRDPRLSGRVNDVVIEGGNSLYQRLADRFVAGESVSDDSLRLIWNNTTQSPFNTLDVPTYAEDVLRTVRQVNATLAASARLRVLLADPPLEWNAIRTSADLQGKTDRTTSQFRVLADSVLAHGRRAIFICGGVHLYKATAIGRENPARRNVVQRLVAAYPRSTYVILIFDGFGEKVAGFNAAFEKLRPATLVPVAGSPLADLAVQDVFAGTPGAPANAVAVQMANVDNAVTRQSNFAHLRLQDVTDAYLYLGPFRKLTIAQPDLERYRRTPALLEELDRRSKLRDGTPFDTARFFAPRSSTAFPSWRASRITLVPVPRDPRGLAIQAMSRAIAAVGGEGRLANLRNVRRVGTRMMSDPSQGYRPAPLGELAPPVLEMFARTVVLDFDKGRSMTRIAGEIFGGQPLESRTVVSESESFSANDLKRTHTALPAVPAGLAPVQRLPGAYAEVILAQWWRQRDSLRLLRSEQFRGRSQDVVALGGGASAPQLFLDSETGLLSKYEAIVRTPLGSDTMVVVYDDWRNVAGLQLPFSQRDYRNGVLIDRFVTTTLEVNASIDDTTFAAPRNYGQLPLAAPRTPKLTKVADDVYVVERGYNSLLVVFDNYVLLIEPALGGPASEAMHRLIEQIAPAKPVRYVVATHFHTDHIRGAEYFLRRGATLVAPPHAVEGVRRILARQEQSDASPIADTQFEPVLTTRAFSDARHTVQLYQVGPNPHAEQILIAYLPKERVLFEGDLLDIDVPPGQAPVAGDDTRAFFRSVRELRIDVSTIVPVHGRIGTMRELETATASRTRR